jgi:hypothetical protein
LIVFSFFVLLPNELVYCTDEVAGAIPCETARAFHNRYCNGLLRAALNMFQRLAVQRGRFRIFKFLDVVR